MLYKIIQSIILLLPCTPEIYNLFYGLKYLKFKIKMSAKLVSKEAFPLDKRQSTSCGVIN